MTSPFKRYVIVRVNTAKSGARYFRAFLSPPNTKWVKTKGEAMLFASPNVAEETAKRIRKYFARLKITTSVAVVAVGDDLDSFFQL